MSDQQRSSTRPKVSVVGQLFLDVVFTGLSDAPVPGREIWTPAFGWGPGGIANQAIAAARLGARTSIRAQIGTDPLSDLCRSALEGEGIDVSSLLTDSWWSLPVTASLGWNGDRALVTGGSPATRSTPELLAGLEECDLVAVHAEPGTREWIRDHANRGTRVIADIGWDPTGQWDPAVLNELEGCLAFLPNEVEAMAFTRTDSPEAAARVLSERVPLAIVTLGARGALAVDSRTGQKFVAPPVPVTFADATGAGDVFDAAALVGLGHGWPVQEVLDFACLVSAISVSRPGGVTTAPRWDELIPWLDTHPSADLGRFDFLRRSSSGS